MSDLLPPNATAQERALSLALARDVAVPVDRLWDPATCPASALPWLAWALSVDDWDTTWSEERKRAVIAASTAVHAYKGTVASLKIALAAMSFDLEIEEWFDQAPPGDPYTFRAKLVIEQEGLPSPEALAQLVTVANGAKNLRSQMTAVEISALTRATEFYGGCTCSGTTITIAAEPAP